MECEAVDYGHADVPVIVVRVGVLSCREIGERVEGVQLEFALRGDSECKCVQAKSAFSRALKTMFV